MKKETNLSLKDLNEIKKILKLLDPNSKAFLQSVDLIDNKIKTIKLKGEKNTVDGE